jgi:ABC-type branched-subunit amino acid transport system ATPase component
MLEVYGVSKRFDGFTAVDQVNFAIGRGEIAARDRPERLPASRPSSI